MTAGVSQMALDVFATPEFEAFRLGFWMTAGNVPAAEVRTAYQEMLDGGETS